MIVQLFPLLLAGALLAPLLSVHLAAQPVISEFLASNEDGLADQDGDHPDWIELFNPDNQPVSLHGWYLTDNPDNLTQWRLPDIELGPKAYLTLFASGKNRIDPGSELHTNFKLSADGEYVALVKPDGITMVSHYTDVPPQHENISYGIAQNITTNLFLPATSPARYHVPARDSLGQTWTLTTFDDSTWASGETALGYQNLVPGFALTSVYSTLALSSVGAAETLLSEPEIQKATHQANPPVLNFALNNAALERYPQSDAFPGFTPQLGADDFALEAIGTIHIPSAGSWTFGVRSDDGFKLQIGSFSIGHFGSRSSSDTLGIFQAPAPGDYPVRLVYFQRSGGAALELFAAQGTFSAWNVNDFQLVGDVESGGLAVSSLPLDSSSAGYASLIRTSLQDAMQGKNASVYLRIPFTVTDPSQIQSLTFRARYEDGLVAYLNGQEVARANAPETLAWDSSATAVRTPFHALQFANFDLTPHLDRLQEGPNLLALQVLNHSLDAPSLLIQPELAEFTVDGLVENFFAVPTPGAPNSASTIAFVGDTRFSHDRGFYSAPFDLEITSTTPGATIRYTTNGQPPTEISGQLYTGPIPISSTTTIRAAAFKEGHQPTNVDTQTYLFIEDILRQSPNGAPPPGWPSSWGGNVVDYGMDPEIVDHPDYGPALPEALLSIPTFSVVMKLEDMFDSRTGIYANPRNDGRDWERPCSVEYILPDGSDGFQVEAGIRIRGGFSRSTGNPKHAFRLFFRGEYGDTKLRFPLFGDNGAREFDNLDLRTFQNYSWSFQGDPRGIFVRDQFSRDTQLAMGHQGERGDFCHLYINGHYWGIFNTCERPEASYGETYFGGDKDDYDVIKVEAGPYTINPTDGNMTAWTRLYSLARNGLSADADYQRVQGNNPDGTPNPDYQNLVDVPNLIDYMLVILYGGNLDAPISNFLGNGSPNNWYGLRNRNGPDGFRFVSHDAEHTLLNLFENRTGPFPAGDSSVAKSNPQWIWQKMWGNTEFKMLMADHVHRHFFNGGVLTPEAVRARLLKRKAELEKAVIAESARWGDSKRGNPLTHQDWTRTFNDVLNSYVPARSGVVLDQLRSKGLYPNIQAPSFNQHGGNVPLDFKLAVSAPAGAVYYTTDGSDPRLRGGAVAPAAKRYSNPIPLPESSHVKSRVLLNGQWSALNEATFTLIQTFTELHITEIMYHPAGTAATDGDEFEFLELKNVSSQDLDLSGVHFTDGIRYTFPNGTRLAQGAFIILAQNPDEFARRYPSVTVFGRYEGRLSNGGETIALNHAAGSPIFSFTYSDASPWPETADGRGFSLVPVSPNLNSDPDDPSNWRASAAPGGSPGRDDPAPNLPAVYINEILTHTDPPQADAVEFRNPGSSPADVSHWFLTDNRSQPAKYQFPAGTTIPAGGFLVLTEADFNTGSDPARRFTFSSHGEQVYLYSANASGQLTGYSHGFSFGAAPNGVSFGRYVTSTGETRYPLQISTSLNAPNTGPAVGPVVINEIHYHPAEGGLEFVELENLTSQSIPLFDPGNPDNTWRLNGLSFSFPPGFHIQPRQWIVVSSAEPDFFRSRYSVPNQVPILGPFDGTLQNSGELLELQRPDKPDLLPDGTLFIPYITVDAVRYNDKAPWPTEPDGTGPSLERITSSNYGNDPINWRSSPGQPSPGLSNTGNRPPLVDAGPDQDHQAASFPFQIQLQGSASDDGEPNPPGQLTLEWRQIDGPGFAVIDNLAALTTTALLPGIGQYTFQLHINDSELAGTDQLVVELSRMPAEVTFIPSGAPWRYLDDGSDQGTAWRRLDFDAASWTSGNAQLGYGDGDETTVVNSGPSNNKFPTTYFRHSFSVPQAAAVTDLTVRLLRDDGAVVYLNGTEVFRSNMPLGDINHLTQASNVVGNNEESQFFDRQVDASLLRDGDNLLAVEVHQISGTSSDISFDLELLGRALPLNTPPSVNAGDDLQIDFGQTAQLNAHVADDGLPVPPGLLNIRWQLLTGPGTVTFQAPQAAATTAAFSHPGIYTLQLTADDGEFERSTTLQVEVRGEAFNDWQKQHFSAEEQLDPSISGPGADPDRDNHSNEQEFYTGTNPRDPSSVLALHWTLDAEEWLLSFETFPGRTYTLQHATSLAGNITWTTVATFPPPQTSQRKQIPFTEIPGIEALPTTGYLRLVVNR